MKKGLVRTGTFALVAAALLLVGCAQRVWVMIPCRTDLGGYVRIGLISFTASDARLGGVATRNFQQAIHEAHPGARVLELGEADDLLASVGRDHLDAESLRLIAEQADVSAVFVGELDVSEVKPTINVSTLSLLKVSGSADAQAVLDARLVEGGTGATVWTRSCSGKASVVRGGFNGEGAGVIGISDGASQVEQLVQDLAVRITSDFRAHYVKRKVDDVPPDYVPTYPDGVEVYAPPKALSQVTNP